MAVQGNYQGTEGNLAIASDLHQRDVVQTLFNEEPELTPLIQLMRRAPRRVATSFKHEWIEFQELALQTQINNGAGYTAGATSIVVDDGSIASLNSAWKNLRTNEIVLVTARSTNTWTVSRSLTTTAAAAMVDNDYMMTVGGAALEGAVAELAKQKNETVPYNLTQIFRDPYGLTNTQMNSNTHGPDYFPTKRAQRGRDHKKQIEMAMFLNERSSDTSGDTPRRTMGGLQEFFTTNAHNFGGNPTIEAIMLAGQTDGRYGASTKLLIGARGAISQIAIVGKDHLRETKGGLRVFGIRMERLRTQHVDYILISHPLFEGNALGKRAFCIDPKNVAYVPLQNRDTKLINDARPNPSADAVKEEWLTECTMQRKLERTGSIWSDVTT